MGGLSAEVLAKRALVKLVRTLAVTYGLVPDVSRATTPTTERWSLEA